MFDPIDQLSTDDQVAALWGRVAHHLGFLHRMHKTNKQVFQAILDGEPDTAKFLLIAIMSDWEEHVSQHMEPGV
jgi:hypothetical protein